MQNIVSVPRTHPKTDNVENNICVIVLYLFVQVG